jgi:hypothetical protein
MEKLLAIDPGPEQSAYVIWDGDKPVFGILRNEDLLSELPAFRKQTTRCVIEMVAHYGRGMPAGKSVFDTCIWIGRFGQVYGWDRLSCMRRLEVKMHLCGQANARDSNVRQALIDRFGAPGTKKRPGLTYGMAKDVWQAFALAVTYLDLCT